MLHQKVYCVSISEQTYQYSSMCWMFTVLRALDCYRKIILKLTLWRSSLSDSRSSCSRRILSWKERQWGLEDTTASVIEGRCFYVIAWQKYPSAEARYFGKTDGLRRIDSSSEEGENDVGTSAQPVFEPLVGIISRKPRIDVINRARINNQATSCEEWRDGLTCWWTNDLEIAHTSLEQARSRKGSPVSMKDPIEGIPRSSAEQHQLVSRQRYRSGALARSPFQSDIPPTIFVHERFDSYRTVVHFASTSDWH
jgi:hypothetical protein